ncbi:hypothetical protein [Desulfogranum marinum]|uniref:hypothetical protein n=1 Tax=Desulfogranum marinum TaxID=453220 RepID=UPI001963970A|nr:hypothetical protein [Desulfogranum marinum]MBM9514839.1 hypothetical protein [Desulfogranum marinum]
MRRYPPKTMAGIEWNPWPESIGMGGRIAQEYSLTRFSVKIVEFGANVSIIIQLAYQSGHLIRLMKKSIDIVKLSCPQVEGVF